MSLFEALTPKAMRSSIDLGPREIAVGEAMRGGATGSTAIGLNPAGLPLNQRARVRRWLRLSRIGSASLVNVSACDSTNVLPGCFYYDYAGSNPDLMGVDRHRSTHDRRHHARVSDLAGLSIGTSTKYFHSTSNVMGESDVSGLTFDFGVDYRVASAISIGAAIYNAFGTDSPEFPRAAGGGILARPTQILALSFDARWKLHRRRSLGSLRWRRRAVPAQRQRPDRHPAARRRAPRQRPRRRPTSPVASGSRA